ncbi:hypothetical protein JMN32_24360 [Fulvivirga sp. 29W222]|uniref:Uncharacterized protein n=2 Tax=Fulvivirga marina TaxID=2494733 RepID=A0A937G3Q3_9BACT|nr:hypothetical protein [Fulvivirga marina]
MCKLSEALDCEYEDIVVTAFTERYNVTLEEAQDIFTETKKWLWLAAYGPKSKQEHLFIDTPLTIIDEMWHNFLLHSKAYYSYCMKKFNKLIHHTPTSHIEKEENDKYYKEKPSEYEKKVKNQYKLIYEKLGSETLIKWYDTMANKYTPEYMRSIKKY